MVLFFILTQNSGDVFVFFPFQKLNKKKRVKAHIYQISVILIHGNISVASINYVTCKNPDLPLAEMEYKKKKKKRERE
jgi:hypothetical protein